MTFVKENTARILGKEPPVFRVAVRVCSCVCVCVREREREREREYVYICVSVHTYICMHRYLALPGAWP
jgi:hypothetical protein